MVEPQLQTDSNARPLIEVKNLRVVLPLIEGNLTASDGVTFTIGEGKTLGLVGESGCGKTMRQDHHHRPDPAALRRPAAGGCGVARGRRS